MQYILNSKYKYLLLLPILFVIIQGIHFRYMQKSFQRTMLEQKVIEIVNHVGMLAAAINADSSIDAQIYRKDIISSVTFLDNLPYVWAGVYELKNQELTLITETNDETTFYPLQYREFISAIQNQESGRLIIGFTATTGEYKGIYRDLNIYFKWMPNYVSKEQQYLIAAGVSKLSLDTELERGIFTTQIITIVVTFIINMFLIIMLVYWGTNYSNRNDDM